MPSSESGEMTSHLSLSCSVKSCSHPFWRPATAASSARWPRELERGGQASPAPASCPPGSLGTGAGSGGRGLGLWHCSAGLWEPGLAQELGSHWELAGLCAQWLQGLHDWILQLGLAEPRLEHSL